MAEISQDEELYQGIFEIVSDGVLITDLETGRILAVNPAAADMHGYSRDDLIGLSVQTLIHAKSLPHFADFSRLIRQGSPVDISAQHVRRDDSKISVEWRAVAFKYRGHSCALAVIRDVSKRVQAEQQSQQRVDVRAHEQTALMMRERAESVGATLTITSQPNLGSEIIIRWEKQEGA